MNLHLDLASFGSQYSELISLRVQQTEKFARTQWSFRVMVSCSWKQGYCIIVAQDWKPAMLSSYANHCPTSTHASHSVRVGHKLSFAVQPVILCCIAPSIIQHSCEIGLGFEGWNNLLLVAALALLLLATSAHSLLSLMHFQPCPGLFRIPLEALEIWRFQLVVRLQTWSVCCLQP